jgi:hypothetical protein
VTTAASRRASVRAFMFSSPTSLGDAMGGKRNAD